MGQNGWSVYGPCWKQHGCAEDDLITTLREPKGKGALFRCNKRTARLEKTMENGVQKGSSSNHVMRCASAHSRLTCGLLDWLMVVAPCGGGHDWHWKGRGPGPRWVCLDLNNFWGPFTTCFSLHECQRPQEGIASRTHYNIQQPICGSKTPPWVQAVLVPGIQEWLWAHQIIKSA